MLPKSILIVDNGSDYLQKLINLCGSAHIRVVLPSDLDVEKAETYDLIILSGGYQHEVMESDAFYAKEKRLILRGKVPILGICLGFQLIAHTFGIQVHKMSRNEHGIIAIHPTEIGKKLLGQEMSFDVYEEHRWVVSKVPKNFHELAISKDGIEILQHAILPIVGLQFHPEMFVFKSDGRTILSSLLTKIVV